ncbi:MAG: DUF4143 domain-containing protein [Actinobacteria bacterium]|nr:DUF4143 domain-containing protein [Actinomycetota bacterium]
MLHQVGKFDYSIKKQKVSSSKIYVSDTSFLKTVSFNFSENTGKRLENLVFLQLKRRYDEIYYHLDKNECDFVIKENLNITQAIQVSQKLDNPVTKQREIAGLLDAMKKYNLMEGYILTLEDDEILEIDKKRIIIKSIWKWLLDFDNAI